MTFGIILLFIYALFFSWHNRLFSKPLTKEEVASLLESRDVSTNSLSQEDIERFRTFMENDDGKPFYMLNLMLLRDRAVYPNGEHPEVKTGKEAHFLYSKMVIVELLKRGSYPIFVSKKLMNLISAGPDCEFFEKIAIVRYRSRRDMLNMILSPIYIKGEPHKWASMDRTAVVPCHATLFHKIPTMVPFILLLLWLICRNIQVI